MYTYAWSLCGNLNPCAWNCMHHSNAAALHFTFLAVSQIPLYNGLCTLSTWILDLIKSDGYIGIQNADPPTPPAINRAVVLSSLVLVNPWKIDMLAFISAKQYMISYDMEESTRRELLQLEFVSTQSTHFKNLYWLQHTLLSGLISGKGVLRSGNEDDGIQLQCKYLGNKTAIGKQTCVAVETSSM